MDEFNGNINDNSVTEEQRENEANASIETEMSGATEAASQPDDEIQNAEGDNIPLAVVDKRPCEPNPTQIQPPMKKVKLEDGNTQDVANAAPPQESNKKKKQVSFKTPPGSPKASTAPVTPSGKHLNQSPDQGSSPVGPTVDSFFAGETNSDDAIDSETGSDTDEAEGAIDGETSSEGSVAEETSK